MIERYTREQIGKIWADEYRFNKMLEVEILVCEALARQGKIPSSALRKIKKAKFNIRRIKKIESTVKHDVIAFLTSVAETVGKESRFIHQGMTSSDVLDTALALQMKDSADIIIADLKNLLLTIKKSARKHKNTLMMGRTHGVHAEPITFGFKLAGWYSEVLRDIERMKRAKENISFGKISGAVGTFVHVSPEVESYVCRKLGLKPEPVSTQIVSRDRHAEYLTTLAVIASSIERFANEIRHLARTEVLEVEEYFSKGQKGSSAMPHKRNPVTCEQVSGLARVIKSNSQASLENVSLWQERDISHSSVERVIIPDSTILMDHILNKFNNVVKNLLVFPENMLRNINLTKDAIFSQRILLELVKKGMTREEAYPVIQKLSQQAWREKKAFKNLLMNNAQVKKYLSSQKIKECFDLKYYTRNINRIFKRLKI